MDIHKLIIREAKPEDVRGINNVLYRAWLETYPNEELGITREDIEESFKDSFTEEYIQKRQENMAQIPADRKGLVAVYEDIVVGVTTMVRNENNNQLRTIYVLPDFQNKGIGKMLYNEAEKFCEEGKDIIVQVATYNQNAIEFYKKLGFVDTGKRFIDEKFTFKNGAVLPEMELVKKSIDS